MTLIDYRPTWLAIDLAKIKNNVHSIQAHIQQHPAVWAVVKDNGYGHGMVPIAHVALKAGAKGLCTATLNEALELREAGITAPILVLTAQLPAVARIAADYQISLALDNTEWLLQAQPLLCNSLHKLQLHYAIDTGMGRIGFQNADQLLKANQIIRQFPQQFQLNGAFTHFTSADLPKQAARCQRQLTAFNQLVQQLPQQPELIHLANSAAALWHPDTPGNVARIGLAMYGLNPSDGQMNLPIKLQPALALYSKLVSVRQLTTGEPVSYGGTFHAERPTWVGTIPLGYGDGYPREMTGFHVLINGQFCEIIGRVCMDQLVVKLPQQLPVGTLVTVIGKSGSQNITVQNIADYCHTNQNQVLVRLNERIQRQYF